MREFIDIPVGARWSTGLRELYHQACADAVAPLPKERQLELGSLVQRAVAIEESPGDLAASDVDKILEDGTQAEKQLYSSVVPEVILTANRFADKVGRGRQSRVDLDDLVSVALVWTNVVVRKYDPAYDVRLETYMNPRLRREMTLFFRKQEVIASVSQLDFDSLRRRNIAWQLGIEERSPEHIVFLDQWMNARSLDAPVRSDTDSRRSVDYSSLVRSDSDTDWADEIDLKGALSNLSDIERDALVGKVVLGETARAIAEKHGVTGAAIGQARERAITKVRQQLAPSRAA